ncbi:MAG: hypothetical protein WBB37_06910 [bacterium]
MKPYIKFLGLFLFFSISCHERNNMFDPGSDDFTPPPAIIQAKADTAYWNPQGYLIGVNFDVYFIEDFEKETVLHNVLYVFEDTNKIEMTGFNITLNQGDYFYTQDVYANYDIGIFGLIIYFGGVPIGAATFAIVDDNGAMVIQPIEEN